MQPRLTAKEFAFAREMMTLLGEAGWLLTVKRDKEGLFCFHLTHEDEGMMEGNPEGWWFSDLDMVRSWVDGFQWGLHLTQGKDVQRYDVVSKANG